MITWSNIGFILVTIWSGGQVLAHNSSFTIVKMEFCANIWSFFNFLNDQVMTHNSSIPIVRLDFHACRWSHSSPAILALILIAGAPPNYLAPIHYSSKFSNPDTYVSSLISSILRSKKERSDYRFRKLLNYLFQNRIVI